MKNERVGRLLLISAFILIALAIVVLVVNAQDADYPPEPDWDSRWVRLNFVISVDVAGYRDGLILIRFENNSGRTYEGVDVWGYYPAQRVRYTDDEGNPISPPVVEPDTRWPLGRYGLLRPYEITIPLGVSYLELDSTYFMLAYEGRTSPFVQGSYSGSGRNTYQSTDGLTLAPIEYEYPVYSGDNFGINSNVVTPQPTPAIPFNICFDFVILVQGAAQYQIYRVAPADDQFIVGGSIAFGQDFEWVNNTGAGGTFYLLIDGVEYSRRYCN